MKWFDAHRVLLAVAIPLLFGGCEDTVAPDTTAPTVLITTPAQDTAVAEGILVLSGTFADDRRVVGAAYVVNGGPEQSLSITPGQEVSWSIALEVPVGVSAATVIARDAAGNEGRAGVRVTRKDVTAPSIRLLRPERDTTVTSRAFILRGMLSDDVAVTGAAYRLNDQSPEQSIPITSGKELSFELPLELSLGQNTVFLRAEDAAGNRSSLSVRIRRQLGFTVIQDRCGLTPEGEVYCGLGGATRRVAVEQPLRSLSSRSGGFPCGLASAGEAYCVRAPGGDFVRVEGPQRFQTLSAGAGHYCALTAPGEAYCWGTNVYGELGNGTTSPSPVPVRVSGGQTFRAISAGEDHTCALTEAGAAHCWGNGYGTVPRPTPGAITFQTIAAGDDPLSSNPSQGFTCGTTPDHVGYCWDGRLNPQPQQIAGETRFIALSPGAYHWCGISTANRAYCWGANFAGQIGNGTSADAPLPTPVARNQEFVSISVGDAGSYKNGSTCAVARDGQGYCWGALGADPRVPTYAYTPVPVP